jgi:hypothetical protein
MGIVWSLLSQLLECIEGKLDALSPASHRQPM